MNITIKKDGEIDLEELFSLQECKKIRFYEIDTTNAPNSIKIYFFDKYKNEIFPKLRKRGKAKKA